VKHSSITTTATFIALYVTLGVGDDTFMSHFEYGQMLYEKPRGVACAACHGKYGEGGTIARYKDENGKAYALKAPAIATLDFTRFYRPFTPQGHSRKDIMPVYHLTRQEVRAIYDYLRDVRAQTKRRDDE